MNKVQLSTDATEPRPAASEYYGEAEDGSREGGFRSQSAMAAAVGDERYKSDSEYRQAVGKLVAKTSEDVFRAPKDTVDPRAAENAEIVVDSITAMMADPRYKTSATYRREVERRLAASMPHNVKLQNPGTGLGTTHRVYVKTVD
jgi:hypothetical protein